MPNTLQSPAYLLLQLSIDSAAVFPHDNTDETQWLAFLAHLPSEPKLKTVCFFDTEPVIDGRLMSGPVIEHHGVQVRVRSSNYTEAQTKARGLASLASTIAGSTVQVNGDTFEIQNISRQSGPAYIGQEILEGERVFNFTINFLLTTQYINPS